ncbi:apolipoprotein N-acyltransferase [Rhodocyclus gracilis]|uniref:Apolipoprotein N-acyltransferase n=1 Tax=Rhodocyclus tenuis TaxID=1066 RepID=A0A6L5K031_RHOTE|nr:apolipoprotein N-acyltransferase [Rhodocyclus gracilis]MQY52701.1 apolipoprotein N-acyltransferase [Rhodocyclus gracilis]
MSAFSRGGAAKAALLALLLGAASVVAFAPLNAFPVLWLTLAGLFALWTTAPSIAAGAVRGAAFGLGFFGAGVSWVYVSLSTFGGMPVIAAAGATFAFCVYLAVFPALAGALFVFLSRSAPASQGTAGRLLRTALFAAAWTLGEWARGHLFTGFPWLSVGYAQTPPSPLAGFAPLLGVFGVGFVSAWLGALLCETVRRPAASARRSARWLMLACAALVLVCGAWLGAQRWTTPLAAPLSVALLQGNIAQETKWRPETLRESLTTYYRLMQEHPAQLTVLPETALPVIFEQAPQDYLEALTQLAARRQGDALVGVVSAGEALSGEGSAGGAQYANVAQSLGVSPPQRYAKSHLVPFGEFTPPGFAWFMRALSIPMSDFTPGATNPPPLAVAGQQVAVNICYEDIFGDEIRHALPQASLLVNLSNVAWFGDSLAPAQHLQIAQMRALESGRMMLRATNTGMTAIVGADGRVQAALPPFTRGALVGDVQGYSGTTPYVRWGDAPALLLAVLLLGLGALRRRGG